MNSELSLKVVLKKAWESFKINMNVLLSLYAVIAVVNIVLGFADHSKKMTVLSLVSYLFGIVAMYVLTKSSMMSVRGEKVTQESILDINWVAVFWLAVVSICYGLMVAIGMVALIIPGVIVAIRFFPVSYVLLDEKLDVVPSFKRSFELTKGHSWDIFLLSVIVVILSIVSIVVTFGIAGFVVMPASVIIGAVIYEKLRNNSLPKKEDEQVPAKVA